MSLNVIGLSIVPNKNSGFIFISVLIIFVLISIVSLYDLIELKNALRLQTELLEKNHTQLQLLKITKFLIQKKSCLNDPIAQLAVKSLNWWRQHGCYQNGFYFLYEKLGQDPCSITGINTVAGYYRLTVVSPSKDGQDINGLLQRSFVTANVPSTSCAGKKRVVREGLQTQVVI